MESARLRRSGWCSDRVSGRGDGLPKRFRPGPERQKAVAGQRAPVSRDMYSPAVLNDPYVVDQQVKVVEALERSCRELREHCEEARAARQRIEEVSD